MIHFTVPIKKPQLFAIVGVDVQLVCKRCQSTVYQIAKGFTRYQFDKAVQEDFHACCTNCGYTETAICCQLTVAK